MTKTQQMTAWGALREHQLEMVHQPMREMFLNDAGRFDKFSISAAGVTLDYSKNRIDETTMGLLLQLANECEMPEKIQQLLNGEPVNNTEQRAAWHSALREQENPLPQVRDELAKICEFCEEHALYTDIINIGIGGSELGPAMMYQAFSSVDQSPRCHFVTSYDVSYLNDLLNSLDLDKTLVIIVSKSFSTPETLDNALAVRDLCANAKTKFVAVTANATAAINFGIDEKDIFNFWPWVGGRYSLWSSVGLSIALSFGFENFSKLLQGAYAMDQHFRDAKLSENMPVILGLLGVWYQNFFNAQSQVIIPYSRALRFLPDYLQQLQMESLGKRVDRSGKAVNAMTGAILWGSVGTNSQHSFHQLLMQGTELVPVDFILPISVNKDEAFLKLAANCIGQSKTLMDGYSSAQIKQDLQAKGLSSEDVDRLIPHQFIPGNNPSNTILLKTLSPETLGALIALYEHKVYVQSVIWNINAFDQWGVQRGKVLAANIHQQMVSNHVDETNDASTKALLRTILD